MNASIKIVHTGNYVGKDGRLMVAVWCVVTIDGREFAKTFYVPAKVG